MIIDMSRLNQVTFNSDDNTYTFGAGVVMDDMVDAFRINQRVMPSGAAGTVSISGYTLGGGVSFYARPLGLAADYLKCIKFVRANGKLVKSCARPSGSDVL